MLGSIDAGDLEAEVASYTRGSAVSECAPARRAAGGTNLAMFYADTFDAIVENRVSGFRDTGQVENISRSFPVVVVVVKSFFVPKESKRKDFKSLAVVQLSLEVAHAEQKSRVRPERRGRVRNTAKRVVGRGGGGGEARGGEEINFMVIDIGGSGWRSGREWMVGGADATGCKCTDLPKVVVLLVLQHSAAVQLQYSCSLVGAKRTITPG